jgi:hypothetical protein
VCVCVCVCVFDGGWVCIHPYACIYKYTYKYIRK